MRVSLIIRTLNEEAAIADCLYSVSRQTKMPDEVLIVDNRSKDKTLEIVRKNDSALKIRIIDNPILGFASGLELGVKKSKYEYVAFLSADCLPEPEWLKSLCEFMDVKGCAVVMGAEYPFPENDIHYVLRRENPAPAKPVRVKYFNNTNTLYNKEILKNFLPFKGVGEYLYGEDTLMALDYDALGFEIYILPVGVRHIMFPTVGEFKDRIYKHAKSAVYIFLNKPMMPRLYLNSYYWVLMEILLSILLRDRRFLKVGYWRLFFTLKGTVAGWKAVGKERSF